MKYTVLWKSEAEQELAAVWIGSSQRAGITAACNEIDRTLSKDPENKGELAFDTVRTLVVIPLGVHFEIVRGDRKVYVLGLWEISNGQPA